MRRAIWAMLALLAAGLLVGCGDDKSDQQSGTMAADQAAVKAVAEKVHQAAGSNDVDAVVALVYPPQQKPVRVMREAVEQYLQKAQQVAQLVERKIGAAQAKEVLASARSMRIPSPLAPAVAGGAIDWSKVKINVKDDRATVEINGVRQMELIRHEGQWRLVVFELVSLKDNQLDEQAREARQRVLDRVAALEKFAAAVQAGEVTGENFRARFQEVTSSDSQ